jgi:para-aminobenzoate synthetase/4-amino-4-deoxychorismate lyase
VIGARFDDLGPEATGFRLVGPVGVLEATRTDEVVPAIEAAEAAAARGLWVAGFVAYEAAPGLDRALVVRPREPGDVFERLPLAWFAMFEQREDTALPEPPDGAEAEEEGAWRPTVGLARYDEAIVRIREHIEAGDAYQVNHTIRLRSTVEGDERGLYRDLCFAQRGPHAAYVNTGRYRICSASPELFFRLDGNRITTRPMKGTAPRGRWSLEDEGVRRRLVASVKDRAENAMIVDLLRNDLGRISSTGSVRWSRVFEPERYETVWQLTSTVSSELAPGTGLADVFRALFPSGSVTGAPKVRSMQIIADLEDSPRGVYTGTVGYLAPPGWRGGVTRTTTTTSAAVFNVAIRTVVVDAQTRVAEYGVGGGITYGSSAAGEYDEAVAKARVLTARRPQFRLLETIRHDPIDGFRNLDLHLARLRGSAAYFGFSFDERAVREALDGAAARSTEHPVRVRLLLGRGSRVSVELAPLGTGPREPVRLAVDDVPVDPADVFLYHKTTLRGRYEQARLRHPAADDVVLVNDRNAVTESSTANVAVLIGGRWWTPPLDAGLLPGIERERLLADGALAERPIGVEELWEAQSIALVSSVRSWRRAMLVVPQSASAPGAGSRGNE